MQDTKELRATYLELLMEAADKDDRIVVLDADLLRANGMLPFRDKYPERTIDCGIAEANMIGVLQGYQRWGRSLLPVHFVPLRQEDALTRFLSAEHMLD